MREPVGQDGGELCATEDGRPLSEVQVGGDDQAGALLAPAVLSAGAKRYTWVGFRCKSTGCSHVVRQHPMCHRKILGIHVDGSSFGEARCVGSKGFATVQQAGVIP